MEDISMMHQEALNDLSGQHGLIAAESDLGGYTTMWNGSYIALGETGSEIGTGTANTKKIVDKLGRGNYAAKKCADLNLNGFNDWFLPSKDELNLLYQNRDKVKGFSNHWYWSSTAHYGGVYFQSFSTGQQAYGSDKSLIKMRQ